MSRIREGYYTTNVRTTMRRMYGSYVGLLVWLITVLLFVNSAHSNPLAATESWVISGQITAHDTGDVIPGAKVILRQYPREGALQDIAVTTTDQDGLYSFTIPSSGIPGYQIRAFPPDTYYQNGYVLNTVTVVEPAPSIIANVELYRGGILTGVARAEDTNAVLPNVTVTTWYRTFDHGGDPGVAVYIPSSTTTDNTGVYTFTNLLPESYYLSFTPPQSGAAAYYLYQALSIPVSMNYEKKVTQDAFLIRGAQITGRVTALDTGNPLSNVTVRSITSVNVYSYPYKDGSVIRTALTDSNGVYTITGILSNTHRLVFDPTNPLRGQQDYLPKTYPVSIVTEGTNTVSDIDIALDAGGWIEGQVRASDSDIPLSKVSVSSNEWSTLTDEQGYYKLGPFPEGEIIVFFSGNSIGEGRYYYIAMNTTTTVLVHTKTQLNALLEPRNLYLPLIAR